MGDKPVEGLDGVQRMGWSEGPFNSWTAGRLLQCTPPIY
jgi:hypothetical protein